MLCHFFPSQHQRKWDGLIGKLYLLGKTRVTDTANLKLTAPTNENAFPTRPFRTYHRLSSRKQAASELCEIWGYFKVHSSTVVISVLIHWLHGYTLWSSACQSTNRNCKINNFLMEMNFWCKDQCNIFIELIFRNKTRWNFVELVLDSKISKI